MISRHPCIHVLSRTRWRRIKNKNVHVSSHPFFSVFCVIALCPTRSRALGSSTHQIVVWSTELSNFIDLLSCYGPTTNAAIEKSYVFQFCLSSAVLSSLSLSCYFNCNRCPRIQERNKIMWLKWTKKGQGSGVRSEESSNNIHAYILQYHFDSPLLSTTTKTNPRNWVNTLTQAVMGFQWYGLAVMFS